jgi:dGTPase
MVCDVIERSWRVRDEGEIGSLAITMGHDLLQATGLLRTFLFERVYNLESSGKEARKARRTLQRLHRHFMQRPGELPPELPSTGDNTERRVIDYIAGMTDQFAEKLARGLAGR